MKSKTLSPVTVLAGFVVGILAAGAALAGVMYLVFLLIVSALGDWGSS